MGPESAREFLNFLSLKFFFLSGREGYNFLKKNSEISLKSIVNWQVLN